MSISNLLATTSARGDKSLPHTEGQAFKVMKSKTAVTVRLLDFMEAMKAEKILASLPGF
jgi:hypothetical protein